MISKDEIEYLKLLEEHAGLINQFKGYIAKKHKYSNPSPELIDQVIMTAAWGSYKAMKKQADSNGVAPYAFGTYMNKQIQSAVKTYEDQFIRPSGYESIENHSNLESSGYGGNAEVIETINNLLSKLDPRESQVIRLRHLEGKTLAECSGNLGVAIQTVKNIEDAAIIKLRALGRKKYE